MCSQPFQAFIYWTHQKLHSQDFVLCPESKKYENYYAATTACNYYRYHRYCTILLTSSSRSTAGDQLVELRVAPAPRQTPRVELVDEFVEISSSSGAPHRPLPRGRPRAACRSQLVEIGQLAECQRVYELAR